MLYVPRLVLALVLSITLAGGAALASGEEPVPLELVDYVFEKDASLELGAVYTVTGTLTLPAGVTLTIPGDVVLKFNPGAGFDIAGRVNQTFEGLQLLLRANADFSTPGYWRGVRITSGAATLVAAHIRDADVAIDADRAADLVLIQCDISNFKTAGVRLANSGRGNLPSSLLGVRIDNAERQGIGIEVGAGVQAVFDGTTVSHTGRALAVDGGQAFVTRSEFVSNAVGVDVSSLGLADIDSSRIEGNDTGVRFDPLTSVWGSVTRSSLAGNGVPLDIRTRFQPQPEIFDARDNWWGTQDPFEIAAAILDSGEVRDAPTAQFIPFLDGPQGQRVPEDGTLLLGELQRDLTFFAGERVTLLGRVIVPFRMTLVLEEGVRVASTSNAGLINQGTLLVRGNAANPVVFTSAAAVPRPGDWRGLQLAGEANEIAHARIEYANVGIDVPAQTARIERTEVTDFGSTGIMLRDGSAARVERSRVVQDAVFTGGDRGVVIRDASPTLAGNTIRGVRFGVAVSGFSAPQIIDGNTIEGNQIGVRILESRDGSDPSPVVKGNNLLRNTLANVSFGDFQAPFRSEALDFRGNFWGLSSAKAIRATLRGEGGGSVDLLFDVSDFVDERIEPAP